MVAMILKKSLVVFIMLVAGLLFYFAYQNMHQDNFVNATEPDLKLDSARIDLSYFNTNFVAYNITAIGVLAAQSCSSCINEFFEFYDQIDSLNQLFFDGHKIEKLVVITDGDSLSEQRYKTVFKIVDQVIPLSSAVEPGRTLSSWGKNNFKNQWVFVNNKTQTISERILVLERITPPEYKWDMLNRVIFSGSHTLN